MRNAASLEEQEIRVRIITHSVAYAQHIGAYQEHKRVRPNSLGSIKNEEQRDALRAVRETRSAVACAKKDLLKHAISDLFTLLDIIDSKEKP